MSNTSISPGIGSIVITGLSLSDTNREPGTGTIVITGNAPILGFRVFPEVGTIALTELPPTNYMWQTVTPSTTTWTVVQP